MKKLLILVPLLVCTDPSSYSQFLGLRGGLNLSSITQKNLEILPGTLSYSEILNKSILRLQAGITAEFPLSLKVKWLKMEIGLILKTKGSNLTLITIDSKYHSLGTLSTSFTGITDLYYLDIPLSFKMYTSAGKKSLYFEIGPYVGIGLSGKQRTWDIRKITWGPMNENDYKRFDSGISMGLGMKIKPFQIGLSYDLGLANIDPSGYRIAHNRVFSVFVEFMILRKTNPSNSN